MAREDLIQAEGKVVDMLAGGNYVVELESNQQQINTKLCGKMRKFSIKVTVGDYVTIGLSPYDLTHGLILFRHKQKPIKPPTPPPAT